MQKALILVLSLFALAANNTSAQTNNTPAPMMIAGGSDISDFDRPRIVSVPSKAAAVESIVVVNTREVERLAFQLLNEKRLENGLQPMAWSEQVAQVARVHSQNMAELRFFGHRGMDSKLVSDRADALRLGKWRAIGENIAFNRGYDDPVAKAIQQWLDSPSHRHNLFSSDWKESAVGVAVAEDGAYYFTQVFLRK